MPFRLILLLIDCEVRFVVSVCPADRHLNSLGNLPPSCERRLPAASGFTQKHLNVVPEIHGNLLLN